MFGYFDPRTVQKLYSEPLWTPSGGKVGLWISKRILVAKVVFFAAALGISLSGNLIAAAILFAIPCFMAWAIGDEVF